MKATIHHIRAEKKTIFNHHPHTTFSLVKRVDVKPGEELEIDFSKYAKKQEQYYGKLKLKASTLNYAMYENRKVTIIIIVTMR